MTEQYENHTSLASWMRFTEGNRVRALSSAMLHLGRTNKNSILWQWRLVPRGGEWYVDKRGRGVWAPRDIVVLTARRNEEHDGDRPGEDSVAGKDA